MLKLWTGNAVIPLGDIGLNAPLGMGQSGTIHLKGEHLPLHGIIA
ncbi:hypothetical protein [uncultured Sulfitobacter sp.]|nr:hypothetical protein [uncultured Sulfitobacter sp.]